ncbi:hypothetical protein EDD28_2794 [Salana multivorans]|uniref:AAA+ ATPase domain-containing protein n=1 Tax=Salana multivorans TaxID=120377 RepID=A0A3N2D0T4_9MICO|nr:hypothetical protein EDD28_2794 [Salana multivorans]
MVSTYRLSARSLLETAAVDLQFTALRHHLLYQGTAVSHGEAASWRGSLPVLARDLADAGLGRVEVLLEHRLPLSSKRTDVVLAGVHPRTSRPSYLVVELKQWSRVTPWPDSTTLFDVDGARYRPSLHPSLQVRHYADYLRDFTLALGPARASLSGVAYLHNASDDGVAPLLASPEGIEAAPLYTGARRGRWLEFLAEHFADESGADAADLLLTSKIGPSKQLLAHAAAEIRDREQFQLLDEQEIAYRMVVEAVRRGRGASTKTAVIVTGGPGSGKSVIALSLLGQLWREGRSALHATGSRSFTQTLRKVAGHRSRETQQLFRYFNQFMDAIPNDLDVLVLDEAHRIRETSVDRYTRKEIRDRARPQIDELLAASRVPVFLLDEHQVVRPGESGTVDLIRKRAAALGIEVEHVDLNGQFRAGGSQVYVEWVLGLLGLEIVPGVGEVVHGEDDTGGAALPATWRGDDRYGLAVADSPHQLEAFLRDRLADGDSARITAGYCWPWSDPTPSGGLVPDVRIGEWSRPWNVKADRSVGDAPPSHLWATEPGGFEQVGCVYTAQGFEYDWNGLILGPDLVWRTDHWVAQREESRDPAFRGRNAVDAATFDRLIRNIYKVLLTRGMKGTVLYSTDPETQEMLRAVAPSLG